MTTPDEPTTSTEELLPVDPELLAAVFSAEELEGVTLRWLDMAACSPTAVGTYVVRVLWRTADVQLLKLTERGLDAHWSRVTHWLGPIPPIDV